MVSFEAPVSSLSCFGKCCKILLLVFNILFMISGVGAATVGIWAIADPTSVRIVVLLNSKLYVFSALILIGAGIAASFVGVIGCCGVRYESKCLIALYTVSLLVVFIAEFAAGVISVALYTQASTLANREMRDSLIYKYGQGNEVEATDAWNYIQRNFECCGWTGETHDAAMLFQATVWFKNTYLKVPPSCCKRDAEGDPINLKSCQNEFNNDMTWVNNVGCHPMVVQQAYKFATILAGVGIGISLFQLFGMILAFCLYRQI
ncbi:CD151 antigen-like [Asterias rubens]|uniref:CD151 antigen-like n=1 Tax=Asterias rubens TaxID=7604 RepID=UPI0014553E67|nr:CD151 antigen-like [Asterias rubens]